MDLMQSSAIEGEEIKKLVRSAITLREKSSVKSTESNKASLIRLASKGRNNTKYCKLNKIKSQDFKQSNKADESQEKNKKKGCFALCC